MYGWAFETLEIEKIDSESMLNLKWKSFQVSF